MQLWFSAIFTHYGYPKGATFGHKRHKNKSKCKKTQLNKFQVKTNNFKRVQVIFRLKYLKKLDFELFLFKKCPKSQIWEFFPKNNLCHFLKDQKICFYGENEEHL